MSKCNSHLFSGTSGANKAQINEMIASVENKSSKRNVIITRGSSGNTVGLETGNGRLRLKPFVDAYDHNVKEVPVIIKKIRLLLEYNTYCLWLYDENGEIIDNSNPPEWGDDQELTEAFRAVNDLYDTFFIDNRKEFSYIGCPNEDTARRLRQLFSKAVNILVRRNNGKYTIQNDVDLENL